MLRREISYDVRDRGKVDANAGRTQLRDEIAHDAKPLARGAHTTCHYHMIAKPGAAIGREVVVAYAGAALARVQDAIEPREDRDVADRLSVLREHDQIAGTQRAIIENAIAGLGLRA